MVKGQQKLFHFLLQRPVNIFEDEFEAYDEVEGEEVGEDNEWAVSGWTSDPCMFISTQSLTLTRFLQVFSLISGNGCSNFEPSASCIVACWNQHQQK